MTSANVDNANWTKECEAALNKQIALEYWAHHQYVLIWSHFDRPDVGLHKIAKFFHESAMEEAEHAHALIRYQNKRGGRYVPAPLGATDLDFLKQAEGEAAKSDALLAFEKARRMEQVVYKALLELHATAESSKDPQFTDYLESDFLEEQVDAISQLSSKCTQLQRIGNDGHGVWNFDHEFE